jgi:hypothetical protein
MAVALPVVMNPLAGLLLFSSCPSFVLKTVRFWLVAVLIRLESVLSSVTARKLGPKPFRPLSNFCPLEPETTNFCT